LIETIAERRGVAPENIVPGAGSSDFIFRALRQWLTPDSHALILDIWRRTARLPARSSVVAASKDCSYAMPR
jgi:histidinol-phosphate/aromatic aminotransferase/cobyric acid decarboxylase-like protein